MRIALVYRSFNMSGSLPRFSVELARHLARNNTVHVYAIGCRTAPELAPSCTFHDVPVSVVGNAPGWSARELLSFARNAATAVAREHYDVVHVRAPSTWVGDVLHVPGLRRGEAELEAVGWLRRTASTVRHPGNAARALIEWRALRNPRLARIHVDAPRVRDDLTKYHDIDPDDVLVVTPGVNLDEFSPAPDRSAAREAVGLPPTGPFALLFCGHDFRRKGLDRAIEAVAATTTSCELLVVGGHDDEPSYRALASSRGITERVRFLGAQQNSAAWFRAADAFVLPTRADLWGATVIEAMAAGTPPIVTAAAGSSSVVEDGRTGLVLAEPFALDDLIGAIDRLADRGLRNALGAAGRLVAATHSWEAHGRLVEEDLRAVADGAHTRRGLEGKRSSRV